MLTGVTDPDAALAQIRSEIAGTLPAAATSSGAMDVDAALAELEPDDTAVLDAMVSDEHEIESFDIAEIDLSTVLSGLTPTPSSSVPMDDLLAAVDPDSDIEDVFAQMRATSAREQQASTALAQYDEGVRLIEQGLDREAIAALETAARVPVMRFRAAARLGRLLIDRGDLNEGIEWLERAAEAPAPSPEDGYDLLYELAGALEAQGESARALAVLMELDAEADGYRDVRTRIMHLTRAQQAENPRS